MDDRIFYGPFLCPECEVMICKASRTQGGEEFTYPAIPYPNSEWARHCCPDKPETGTP